MTIMMALVMMIFINKAAVHRHLLSLLLSLSRLCVVAISVLDFEESAGMQIVKISLSLEQKSQRSLYIITKSSQ